MSEEATPQATPPVEPAHESKDNRVKAMPAEVEHPLIPADVIARRPDIKAKLMAKLANEHTESEPEKAPEKAEAKKDEGEKKEEGPAEDPKVKALVSELEALRDLAADPESLAYLKELVLGKKAVPVFLSIKRKHIQAKTAQAKATREQQGIEARRQSFEAERQAFYAERKDWASLRERDPIAFARRLGLTFRQMAEAAQRDGEPQDPKAFEVSQAKSAAEKALEETTALKKQLEDERAQLSEQHEITQLTSQVETWLKQREDQYPHVFAEYDPGEIARQAAALARKQFRETGLPLDVQAEFSNLEKALAERQAQRQQRLSANRRVEPAKPVADSAERGNGAVKTAKPGTTDSLSTADASQKTSSRPMTREDRLQEALRHFQ